MEGPLTQGVGTRTGSFCATCRVEVQRQYILLLMLSRRPGVSRPHNRLACRLAVPHTSRLGPANRLTHLYVLKLDGNLPSMSGGGNLSRMQRRLARWQLKASGSTLGAWCAPPMSRPLVCSGWLQGGFMSMRLVMFSTAVMSTTSGLAWQACCSTTLLAGCHASPC
eukprot:417503-Prymnesium_polylepis.2